MNRFLICLAFIIAQIQLNAQSIVGVLTDKTTEETLIGASVIIKGTTIGTASDFDGNYTLKVEELTGTLVFSYVGYESVEIDYAFEQGQSEIKLDVQLSEGNLLDEMVVTASKFERKIGEETVSIDVIKPKLLGDQNLTDVSDALGKSPGVTIVDGQANIRGGSGYSFGAGSRVLLLQDGLPISQADAGLPIWSSIPVENIGQIEIIKGAASALYGSSAMNGIINVQTAFAKNDPETYLSLSSTYFDTPRDQLDEEGNVIDKRWWLKDSITYVIEDDSITKPLDEPHPYNVNFAFSHRRKMGSEQKVDFVIGGNYFKEQKWRFGEPEQRGRITGSLKYRISEKTTFGFGYAGRYSTSGNFFLWNGLREQKYIPSVIAGEPTETKSNNFAISPYVSFTDKKDNIHRLKTRYLRVENKNTNNQSNSSNFIYGEYQFQRVFTDLGLSVSAGTVGSYVVSNSALFGDRKITGSNIAFYGQADKKFFEKLNASLGFRLETNFLTETETETKPVVRLGLNYQAAEATYIRASFGQGYRFPTIAEKFISTEIGGGLAILPNEDLTSETGLSVEVGVKQGWQTSNKAFKGFLDVAFFYTRYNDMMEFTATRTPEHFVAFSSDNVGNTFIYGVETNIFAQGKLKSFPTNVIIGYTFIDPKFQVFDLTSKNGGIADYNVLKYRYRHTLTASWDIDFNGLTFGTSWQYFSFLENLDVIFDDPSGILGVNFTKFRDQRLKDGREPNKEPRTYRGDFILDLRIGYHTKNNIFKVSFNVKNVANREYVLRPALIEAPRNYSVRFDIAL